MRHVTLLLVAFALVVSGADGFSGGWSSYYSSLLPGGTVGPFFGGGRYLLRSRTSDGGSSGWGGEEPPSPAAENDTTTTAEGAEPWQDSGERGDAKGDMSIADFVGHYLSEEQAQNDTGANASAPQPATPRPNQAFLVGLEGCARSVGNATAGNATALDSSSSERYDLAYGIMQGFVSCLANLTENSTSSVQSVSEVFDDLFQSFEASFKEEMNASAPAPTFTPPPANTPNTPNTPNTANTANTEPTAPIPESPILSTSGEGRGEGSGRGGARGGGRGGAGEGTAESSGLLPDAIPETFLAPVRNASNAGANTTEEGQEPPGKGERDGDYGRQPQEQGGREGEGKGEDEGEGKGER